MTSRCLEQFVSCVPLIPFVHWSLLEVFSSVSFMNVNEQINFQSNMSDEKRPRLKSRMTSSTNPLPRAPADEKKKKKKKEATTRLFPSEGGGDRKCRFLQLAFNLSLLLQEKELNHLS